MWSEIKDQWARDDPAFIVVMIYFISAASLAYSITFGFSSLAHFLRLVAGSVLIELLGTGALVATAYRSG